MNVTEYATKRNLTLSDAARTLMNFKLHNTGVSPDERVEIAEQLNENFSIADLVKVAHQVTGRPATSYISKRFGDKVRVSKTQEPYIPKGTNILIEIVK